MNAAHSHPVTVPDAPRDAPPDAPPGTPEQNGLFGFVKRVARCRLCWKVTAAVFAAILGIEAVLLGFSAFFYEQARFDEVEQRGRVAWQALTDSRAPNDDWAGFLAAAESQARGHDAILIGGIIYDASGKRLGTFGETPAIAGPVPTDPNWRLVHETPRRIDTVWPATATSGAHSLVARLNAAAVSGEVQGFISRVVGQVLLIALFVTGMTIILLHHLILAPMLYLSERLASAGDELDQPERHRLPEGRSDELGDVARAFNGMLGQLTRNLHDIRRQEVALAEANRDLEEKVLDRTQDLLNVNHALELEIDDRKQAETEIANLARFPEENPSPVVRAAFDGEVLYANRAGRKLLDHWQTDVGARLPAPWDSIVANAASSVEPHELDTESADGQTFSLTFQPLGDAGYVNIYGYDVTARRQAEERVRHLANHDSLTGLPNRALFQDRLQQSLRQAQRAHAMVAVHMLDLDHFKDVNDTLGHAAGDKLLVEIAGRLQHCVRDSDTVARLGGDEFAVIQPVLDDSDGAAILAQKMLEALAVPLDIEGHTVYPGGSIGITIYPDDADGAERLLRNADMALYQAKGEGRGVYRFFVAELNDTVLRRRELEDELRDAIVRQDFILHYQPKLSLDGNRIAGMESLIRWNHPELGFLSPAEFIPVAEASKLIVPIGRWVLAEACRQTKAWQDAGGGAMKVAVNLSAVQLREASIVDDVRKVLSETGLSPACLELEITESVAMDDAEATIGLFERLSETGVSLSIDDFGTGYSSLAYLKNFPVQRIKIDKAFVDDIAEQRGPIAEAVTTLGHSFGMEITAEGVETQDQMDFLAGLGCDEIQGYFVSRPLTADDFSDFITQFPADQAAKN